MHATEHYRYYDIRNNLKTFILYNNVHSNLTPHLIPLPFLGLNLCVQEGKGGSSELVDGFGILCVSEIDLRRVYNFFSNKNINTQGTQLGGPLKGIIISVNWT